MTWKGTTLPSARIFIATLAVLALVATGCGGQQSAAGDAAKRTVDSANGPVSIPAKPKRVVVLWKPTLAAAVALGFRPVGTVADPTRKVADLMPYLPAGYPVDQLSVISNTAANDINLEKIAKLGPDLIIGAATANGKQTGIRETLGKIAPVVLLPWAGNSSWRQHFSDVAGVLGGNGAGVVASYQQRVAKAKAALGNRARKPVSLVRVQGTSEFRIETPASFPGSVVADVGIPRPAAQRQPDKGKDFRTTGPEQLDLVDGDTIFVLANVSQGGTVAAISSSPLWTGLAGVRAHRVFSVDFDYWNAANYYSASHILDDLIAAYTGAKRPL
ncbi:iron-siderophore ABC transporter substrate-binding protein [Fodinicola acaciae]|uniref:iron-siderophore ABC transporter substrate-binding protein n=1 Tax=Fodinicola acaciae TaxID=2681555 RepID=UPI0013D40406|nr:iron-siderophore ABC transporter substrate-binding protein [Fodinicola acaciae]